MTEENNVIDHKVENTNRVVGLSEEKFIKVFEYIKLGAYQADLARVGESSEAEKALELTNKALKLDPSNNEALLLKAVILNYLLARHKEAIDIFNKIATSEYRVWSDIGHAYEALEKYKEAINCYNKVPSSGKSYIAARYVIGTAYYKLEDYKICYQIF